MRTGDRGWIELHELLTVILQPSEDGGLCSVLEARTNGPLGIQRVGSCPRTMVDPPSCETGDGDGVRKPVQSLLRTTRSNSLSRYFGQSPDLFCGHFVVDHRSTAGAASSLLPW